MDTQTIHARFARFLRYVAFGCASLAAVSTTLGLHLANPSGGWLVPVFTGVVLALALGTFWHVLIEAAERVRTKIGTTVIVAAGILAALVALGTSASNIATAMAGRASVSAELAVRVDDYSSAVSAAHVEAKRFQPLVSVTATAAASMNGKADLEARGGNGHGAGCGPRCDTYKGTANAFGDTSARLRELGAKTDALRETGMGYVGEMRTAAAQSDQVAFAYAAQRASTVIDDLNAIDAMPLVAATGMVEVSELASTLTPETADLQDRAREITGERQQVAAPTFTPFSVGEATRAQMGGAALQAWIAAGVIDILPFLFLITVLLTAREPLLREAPTKLERKSTPEPEKVAQIRSDEDHIAQRPYLAAGE
jgi:heme exporter protein D